MKSLPLSYTTSPSNKRNQLQANHVRSDANADSSRTGGTRIAGVGSKGSAGVPAHFHAGSWGSHRSHQSNRGEKNAEIERLTQGSRLHARRMMDGGHMNADADSTIAWEREVKISELRMLLRQRYIEVRD